MVKLNDVVYLKSPDKGTDAIIARIMSMWSNERKQYCCHVHWFRRATDTLLGNAILDRQEVVRDC